MSCISGAAVRADGTVASGAICSAGLDTRTSDSMTGRPERVLVAPQPVEAAGLFSNLLKPSPVIALGRGRVVATSGGGLVNSMLPSYAASYDAFPLSDT